MKAVRTISICALILCALAGSTAEAQTWRKALEPSYPGVSFNDIFFFDVNHGWAVGSRGTVLYTANGGADGLESVIDTLLTLQTVFFRDVNNGFVGANNRTLCKTTDGGATWTSAKVLEITDTAATIRSVYFADANRGWILSTLSSTNGKVLHTTDGGTSWTVDLSLTGTNSNLIDMDFWSADTGVVTGKSVGMLYYTTNGTTWNLAPTPTLGGVSYTRSDVRAVDMVSATTAYAVGWGSTVGAQPSIHLKTTDGGATWTYMAQSAGNRTYDNLYAVWFKDASNGLATGGGSILVRTTDAGSNWVPLVLPTGATIYGLSGSGDDVWMDGSDGVLYHSTDFGTTWTLVIDVPSATLNALQWVTPTVGYASGFDAIFLKTTNGGNDWKGSFVSAGGVSQNVNDIFFVNENVGFAVHSYRMISKTTDGGATWAKVLSDTSAATVSTLGVYFVDADTGYAVGQLSSSNGVVYKTTDAGASWVTKSAVATKTLRGVAFGDAAHGVITGATRTMMYTTNAGASWTAATLNNVPANRASVYMRRVRFLTSTTAIAVGDSTILRSTDAGATWEYVATASKTSLNNIEKGDALTAFAVGNGEVWKTTDAGATWNNIIDPAVVTGTLYSVAVDSRGDAWVGAGSSTLFTTAGTVGVDEEEPLTAGYRLAQNFPNPFNPSTVITFQVPSTSMVTLTVYDLLGRTVATLVNERKAAGSYDVRFEGAGLSTGMYLYRISAGGFVQTRKMLLVK